MLRLFISIVLVLSIFSELMIVKKNSMESNLEKVSLLLFIFMTVLLINLLIIKESNEKKQS